MTLGGLREPVRSVEPYVAGKTVEEVRRELGLETIIKLGSNENPYGPFPESLRAMEKELPHLNRYPDVSFQRIKALLSDLQGLPPECFALSHGAEGMLQTMGKCFIEAGDEVLLPAATYSLYLEITRLMGGLPRTVPLTADFRADVEALRRAVGPRTKLIWLANPNNPTGTVCDGRALEELVEGLPEKVWLVLDEAYAEFAEPSLLPDRRRLIAEGRNVIAVRTFSKAWGLAGARLGYAMARPEMVTVIDTVSEPFNANRIGLAGAQAALVEGRSSYERALERILSDRSRLAAELERLGCSVTPSQTNFLFFETPFGAPLLARALLREGVIVRSCEGWGFDRALRVTVGTTEETARFVSVLERLLKTFDEGAEAQWSNSRP